MRTTIRTAGATLAMMSAALSVAYAAPAASDPPTAWAFVVYDTPVEQPTLPAWVSVPGSLLRVPGERLDSDYYVPDWFPADHPPMPEPVAHGRPPHLLPCALCHMPTGVGDPGAAAIAGLPAAYIKQQFAEFRSGRRQCAVPKDLACSRAMPMMARAASAAELAAAAEYFSHLTYHSRIHVREAVRVPATRDGGFELLKRAGDATQPIGERIIEVPDNALLEDEGDWRSGITAYVPPGSIERGRALVASGAGARPCAACHGAHFQGIGMAPPLAGRSPTYIVRQLYDIKYGYRRGPAVALMEPEVAHLSAPDRVDIAAYLASLGN